MLKEKDKSKKTRVKAPARAVKTKTVSRVARTRTRYAKSAKAEAGFIINGIERVDESLKQLDLPKHTERAVRHGTKFVTKLIERTGIPEGYSTTIAWFAERAAIATLALIVFSFASGAIFVLKLSEPIAESQIYTQAEIKAIQAQDGIRVFSQQVIDVASPIFGTVVKENREVRDIEAERLAVRKERLKAYLASKNSPFAEEDEAIEAFASSKNMKMMVAISFVESTFGKNCYYHNCSGIGGTPPTLRKYDSYAEWIRDFDDLLERRYKDIPPEGFLGLYVQPGSPNWIYGVKQVIREFEEQQIEANDIVDTPEPVKT